MLSIPERIELDRKLDESACACVDVMILMAANSPKDWEEVSGEAWALGCLGDGARRQLVGISAAAAFFASARDTLAASLDVDGRAPWE